MSKEEKNYEPEKESVNEIITDYEHYQEEKEFEKNSKSNEEIMKEKVSGIIDDLNEVNYKQDKRDRKKAIILLIAILIEVVVVVFILTSKKIKEEYKMIVKCTNNESELYADYSMKMINKYYFNDYDKVVKTENEILYAYNNREAFNKHVLEKDITNFKGYKKQSVKDKDNLIYKTVITYDYKKLKDNSKVSLNKGSLTFTIPSDKEETVITVQNYDDVIETNKIMGFTCE